MQRRGEFTFPGSPARGVLPPRPPTPAAAGNATAAPRYGVEDEEEVRWLQASRQASPDYSSGTPSPQMWAYHPERHHHHHQHQLRPYPASAGSSPSRAQAIAGYRREMLDLVRGLPESAYELSLRDIVEHPAASSSSSPPPPPEPLPPQPSNAAVAGKNDEPAAATADKEAEVVEGKKEQSGSGKRKQGRKQRAMMRKQRSRSMERSVSLDTGLLIKLFMPLSMGGKKKVSPRPDDGKKKKEKEKKQGKKKKQTEAAPPEEEWWGKNEFSEAGGSSRTSSTGSSSNSNISTGSANPRAPARSWSRKRTGCYAFFRANKSKNGVGQD